MKEFVGLAALLILVLALCNPRLWKDLKTGFQGKRSSMDNVLAQGKADLKDALHARKENDHRNMD